MNTPTTLARSGRITAVWYAGRVISAWYADTGDLCSLHEAHALTAYPDGQRGTICEHGLVHDVCMVCGARPDGGLEGG